MPTAVNITNDVDAAAVEQDEAIREEDAHRQSGMIRRICKARNHGRFETESDHATS